MADLNYDAANGEDLYDGTLDFKAPNDAFDPATTNKYMMEAKDFADLRDFAEYIRQDTVIGNAKKIQGIDVDATTATTPSDNDVLQYDSATGDWLAQPIELSAIDYIDFDPQATPPSELEGRLYFDDAKQTMVYFNDATGTALDIGREMRLERATNNTGSPITNGQVVYISGAAAGKPEVSLAIGTEFDTSRVIAMCTEASVADGADGEFTAFGQVGGLNTSSYSPGDKLYLSTSTAGAYQTTRPSGEYYACCIGTVLTSDATDGHIFIAPNTPDLTAEMSRNKGFPANNATEATLSFVDGTRTFAITPTGTEFHFYQEGIKYTKSTAQSIVIANTTGNHFIYFDSGVLSEMVNPTFSQTIELILNKPLVAYIYWNATEGYASIVAEERHKAQTTDGFTPRDHVYTHVHEGARYLSGYDPSNVVTDGSTSLNTSAQFGTGAGSIDDEDITNNGNAIASTTGLRYYYRNGATGIWNYGTNAGYNFPVGATPLPQYNEWTGATWQLSEISSGNFMLAHVFAVNSIDEDLNTVVVLGQNEYSLIGDAQAAALTDISAFSRGDEFPFQEFVPLYTFIIEGKTSFTNTPQARYRSLADGSDYADFRSTTSSAIGGTGGATPPGGNDTEVQYNNAGAFGGSSDMTFDDATGTLTVTNLVAGTTFGPPVVSAAGATPVDSDVSAWGNNTMGVVVGTGGRVWQAFKNATDVYYVEMTAI
jgi:hypothetical protein